MHLVRSMTQEAGQSYTLFTNNQQLYKITTQMTLLRPMEWEGFYATLGGMLVSFVGCVGTLMSNTGLAEVMTSAFGGVDKMLKGKNNPQNVRAQYVYRGDTEPSSSS